MSNQSERERNRPRAAKQKHDKQRAAKHKHEHQSDEMYEAAAKHKRMHVEATIAMIVLLIFVPFMIILAVYWAPPSQQVKPAGGTGLANGTYTATYVSTLPGAGLDSIGAKLVVNGGDVFVGDTDLTGQAADTATAFFNNTKGQQLQITVKNGFITNWKAIG